ncbi:unnamed protein product [Ambrosiozyma monospora]|uniref:Unnamed protein product n=1 Tax=Ambrosiozyma monospora TaxID=43982 RepID=A0ACB5SZK0_AMBMO|nr:unnamed protein product [Ambrosiozyma monospora]
MTFVTQEKVVGESIQQRTSILDSINDLGPPDLVHLTKSTSTQAASKTPGLGTYFYYTGADCSNSATIAATLNHLANIIGEKPQPWFGKTKYWKVTEATYCTYNAFSRNEVRVRVTFPGQMETTIMDSQGNKVLGDDKNWTETFVTGIVRSLITADNDSADFTSIVEIRKINPFITEGNAEFFFKAFEELFFEGYKLGCSDDAQIPTVSNNYLIDAFILAVQLTGKFEEGLEILSRLKVYEPSIAYLTAKLYLMNDKEVKAIQVLHDSIKENPLDGELLILQSQYCLDKNRLDLALPLAIKAVNSLPSYFKSWALLVKVYIASNQIDKALLTLNSCPMVTHRDKYYLKRISTPTSDSLHLPLPLDVTLDQVTTLNSMDIAIEHNKVDPALLNLPAANLKSTFAKAYDLLTEIVKKTGWEALLKHRTKVFVMEEEFKKDGLSKRSSMSSNMLQRINTNGTENASATGASTVTVDGAQTAADSASSSGMVVKDGQSDFKKKRLCERWLDNLFMLLYDDLRTYTIYKAEAMHFEAQQLPLTKSTLEWELIGLVAQRLGHTNEAAKCYERGLMNRFSVRSCKKLLQYYQEQRSYSTDPIASEKLDDAILELVVKLLVWNHRWYCSFSPNLINTLRKLVNEIGSIKIENEVKVRFDDRNTGVSALVKDNLKYLELYNLIDKDS